MSTLLTLKHSNPAVRNVSFDKLIKLIDDSFLKKSPLVLWGSCGIGKCSIVKTYAKENDIQLKEINLNLRTQLIPEFTFPYLKSGILVLDLMNSISDIGILNKYLELLKTKTLPDGKKLGDGWSIIGICCKDGFRNRKETENAIIDYCCNNKIRQINYVPELADFERYLAGKDSSNKIISKVILDFLRAKPGYFCCWHDDDIVGTNPGIWDNIINFLNEYSSELNLNLKSNFIKSLAENRMVYLYIAGIAGIEITRKLIDFMSHYE